MFHGSEIWRASGHFLLQHLNGGMSFGLKFALRKQYDYFQKEIKNKLFGQALPVYFSDQSHSGMYSVWRDPRGQTDCLFTGHGPGQWWKIELPHYQRVTHFIIKGRPNIYIYYQTRAGPG